MKLKIYFFLLFSLFKIDAQQQISDFKYESTNVAGPTGFIKYNNKIYFDASPTETGKELWGIETNSENITLLKDILPGIDSGIFHRLDVVSTVMNGHLYFIAQDENSSSEIWRTDGTTEGTVKITNFLHGGFTELTTVGNFIYFLRKSSDYVLQVWKTDGTTTGTVLVQDDIAIVNSPTYQGVINNTFVFTIGVPHTSRTKVWRSDGTAIGTFPITPEVDGNGSGEGFYVGGGTAHLSQYYEMNGKLYFVTRRHLYVTDGTLANTKIVSTVYQANTNLAKFSDVISLNGKLYLMFYTSQNELIIWESDGTGANTKQIYFKRNPNSEYFIPSKFFYTNNALHFLGPNSLGTTSVNSLDLNNYTNQILNQVTVPVPGTPGFFVRRTHEAKIHYLGSSNYFVSIPGSTLYSRDRTGWIFNSQTSSLDKVETLNGIFEAYSNNETLYFGRDLQVWKFDSSTLTTKNINIEEAKLFPNPANDYFTVESKNSIDEITIINMSGQIVLTAFNLKDKKINISSLCSGTYIVKISTDNKIITKKIIKK